MDFNSSVELTKWDKNKMAAFVTLYCNIHIDFYLYKFSNMNWYYECHINPLILLAGSNPICYLGHGFKWRRPKKPQVNNTVQSGSQYIIEHTCRCCDMETLSALLALCGGIYKSPVDPPHKGPVKSSFDAFLAWTSWWTNSQITGDLRCLDAHVTLLSWILDAWIILCMCPANERWHHSVTPSLIGWAQPAHIQNAPCRW